MPHIICITESWLDNYIPDESDEKLSISGFKLLHLDRKRLEEDIVLYNSIASYF